MAVDMNLYALPEGCIAKALPLTSPRDACRLSLVASTFRSAAQSDAVWERFLPTDYRDILGRSKEGVELLRSIACKKELYLYLCDHPILIDGATKRQIMSKFGEESVEDKSATESRINKIATNNSQQFDSTTS